MRRTIVCLANSYKHGGRCVAGISLKDGKWVRLRSYAEGGALDPHQYTLDEGSEVRVLDLVEVELDSPHPSNCHPEDWHVAPATWRLLERPVAVGACLGTVLQNDKTTTVLRGYRDRIGIREIRERPLQSSLALLAPADLHWWIRDENGKRKCRALFKHHRITYDLPLTDPVWIAELRKAPLGIYPHAALTLETSETWLTVSLSEEFHGWHYKLVAAVIMVPKSNVR